MGRSWLRQGQHICFHAEYGRLRFGVGVLLSVHDRVGWVPVLYVEMRGGWGCEF